MGDLVDIIIREAKKEDAELLRSIEAADGFDYPYQKTANDYIKYFDEGNNFYIAEANGDPIGYVATVDSNNFLRSTERLHFIAIKQEHQGKGIGTKLVQHIEELAKTKGKDRIIVFVYENNSDAMSFYVKQGFKSWFVVPHLYENGISAHVYAKDIGPMYIKRMEDHVEKLTKRLQDIKYN